MIFSHKKKTQFHYSSYQNLSSIECNFFFQMRWKSNPSRYGNYFSKEFEKKRYFFDAVDTLAGRWHSTPSFFIVSKFFKMFRDILRKTCIPEKKKLDLLFTLLSIYATLDKEAFRNWNYFENVFISSDAQRKSKNISTSHSLLFESTNKVFSHIYIYKCM